MKRAATVAAAAVMILAAGCGGAGGGQQPKAVANRSIYDHPWWKGRVQPANVEQMMEEMTKHRVFTLFFDQSGQFHVFPDWYPLSVKSNDQHERRSAHYQALDDDVKHETLKRLNHPRQAVVVSMGYGDRVSLSRAERLLEIALDQEDSVAFKLHDREAHLQAKKRFEEMDRKRQEQQRRLRGEIP